MSGETVEVGLTAGAQGGRGMAGGLFGGGPVGHGDGDGGGTCRLLGQAEGVVDAPERGGAHQLSGPARHMRAGTSTPRTRMASMRMARAVPIPNSWRNDKWESGITAWAAQAGIS